MKRWLPALALAAFVFTSGARAQNVTEIVVGMSAAFSGPTGQIGTELYRGSMAYFESINAKGGVYGRKIRIKAYDDVYDPTRAILNTVKLIDHDHVFLLFDYVGTATVTRILPVLERFSDRQAYLFFPFTGAEPQRQPPYDKVAFNLRASYRDETAALVDYFIATGKRRIAIFYQVDAYGRSGWDGVRKALASHGLKIVSEATYRRGTPYTADFRPHVNILRESGADAVVSIAAYQASAGFVRDAVDEGWQVPIANVSFVGSESMLDLLQKEGQLRKKDYTRQLVNSQVVPSYDDLHLPAVLEYRDMMAKYEPALPADLGPSPDPGKLSFVGFEGFLNAKLLAEILTRSGKDLDKDRLKDAVLHVKDFDLGIEAPVTFGPGKNQGLSKVYFTRVENGRFVPLRAEP